MMKLIKILSGEPVETIQCCKFWQEAFVCYIYHCDQDCNIMDIP